jgi:hypothetical protein
MPDRAPSAAGEPRFVLGPLTLYADVATMEAWLETANPGDELRYATGPALGRDAPAGLLARQWADEGEVVLFQRRPGPGKPLEYVARRKEPPVRPRSGGSGRARLFGQARRDMARPGQALPADFEGSEEGRMLAVLTEAADAGAVCPSNVELARRLDLKSRDRAQYLINRLARASLIRVASSSSFDGRTVTIVATGRATAAREGGRVLWRERAGA